MDPARRCCNNCANHRDTRDLPAYVWCRSNPRPKRLLLLPLTTVLERTYPRDDCEQYAAAVAGEPAGSAR